MRSLCPTKDGVVEIKDGELKTRGFGKLVQHRTDLLVVLFGQIVKWLVTVVAGSMFLSHDR